MNLLSVTGVSHDYPHHGRVLHEIQLAIAPGETVALLGRSGCGKSTLARMLVGLETPQHGDIAWRGAPLAALKGEAIGAPRYSAGISGCLQRGESAQNGARDRQRAAAPSVVLAA